MKQVSADDGSPLFSVLFHGPLASGKTALVARIASDSGYPFVRLISPEGMVAMTESPKVSHIINIFSDAYKSRTGIVVSG